MRNSLIYVHYEPLAHLFLTAGVSASDVLSAKPTQWRHLLLLPPVNDQQLIEPHTGFNLVNGQDDIAAFLRSKDARDRSWLDFQHASYLDELTPTEIAELLYLGHMKTHIQPPFYYKLQNTLVYLPLKNEMVTMYFRQMTFFVRTLSAAIVRHLRLAANDQPFWLRLRQQHFAGVPTGRLSQLYPLLEDGLYLDFSSGIFSRDKVVIPLLEVDQRFLPEGQYAADNATVHGQLVLHRATNRWELLLD